MPKATIIWFGGDDRPFKTFTLKKGLVSFFLGLFALTCISSIALAVVSTLQYRHIEKLSAKSAVIAAELQVLSTSLEENRARREELSELNRELGEELKRVRVMETRVREFLGLDGDPSAPERANQGGEAPTGYLEPNQSLENALSAAKTESPDIDSPAALSITNLAEVVTYLEQKREDTDKLPTILPVTCDDAWISCYFGWRTNPMSGEGKEYHNGLDIAGKWNSPIIAPADGKVIRSAKDTYLGNYVKLSHGDGLFTTFGHLEAREVKVGETIKRGDVIGRMGNTGRTTGTHLHYAIIKDKRYVNPLEYIWDSPSNQLARR